MEKPLLLIIFLTVLATGHMLAQDNNVQSSDSLKYDSTQITFTDYLKKITRIADVSIGQSDFKSLMNIGELFKQEFGELTTREKHSLRYAAMMTAFNIAKKTGDNNAALEIYLIAHENVEDKNKLDTLAWYIENEIFNIYTMLGDYDKSKYYSKLLENSLNYYGEIELLSRLYTNLGRMYKSELRPLEAKEIFELGLHLADSVGYNLGIFANALNLAELFNDLPALGLPEPYLLQAEELLPLLQSERRFLEKKAGLLMQKARFQNHQGKCAESITLYKEAILILGQYYKGSNKERREFAKYNKELAKAFLDCDSLDQTAYTIHEGLSFLIPDSIEFNVLPQKSQLYPENTFVELLDLRARLFEKKYLATSDTHYLINAIQTIEVALQVNDLIRESVLADASKLVAIGNNKLLIGMAISLVHLLYLEDNKLSYFELARNLFSRSKSLLFNEKSRKNNLFEFFSDTHKIHWIALHQKLLGLYEKKFEKGVDINFINGQILECQEQLDDIYGLYEDKTLVTHKPVNYIEYFMDTSNIYVISEINDRHTLLKLNSTQEFNDLSKRLDEFILLKGRSLDDTIQYDMYHFLVQPVLTDLPTSIVIIPDEAIGYVPFEMLKDNEGNYLIDKCTISYSFEYITEENESENTNHKFEIFCLAPLYPILENKASGVQRGYAGHLPYAQMEVDSIKSLYGKSAFISQSGEKQQWSQDIPSAPIFHYAGHAIVKGEESFLLLNNINDEKQQLTGYEISLMHHPLDLVVLSACETGLGKLENGEGIRSLGRSFMESGAKATIISLWNVNDKSTALIMFNFYKYLKSGFQKDEALRLAKIEYKKSVSSRNQHPYFWAAFIPAGNMKPLVSSTNN